MRMTQRVIGLDHHPGVDFPAQRRFVPPPCAMPNGRLKPSASPPPAAAVPTMNLRREMFGSSLEIVFFMLHGLLARS